jgi:tRNA threonylcarbamoyladenosine biosynthesis protein TsaE
LDRIEEIIDLGLDDYLYGKGVCIVEWAEKALTMLPEEHLLIEMGFLADTSRSLRLKPSGDRYLRMLPELEQRTRRWKSL